MLVACVRAMPCVRYVRLPRMCVNAAADDTDDVVMLSLLERVLSSCPYHPMHYRMHYPTA